MLLCINDLTLISHSKGGTTAAWVLSELEVGFLRLTCENYRSAGSLFIDSVSCVSTEDFNKGFEIFGLMAINVQGGMAESYVKCLRCEQKESLGSPGSLAISVVPPKYKLGTLLRWLERSVVWTRQP